MAAVMLQVIPSFYTNFSRSSLFISANKYEKHFASTEYCFASHDDKFCSLPNSRCRIMLRIGTIGDIKDLPQKFDAFCFNYQDVDCLYALFKYPIQWQNCCREWANHWCEEGGSFQPPKQRSGQNAQLREIKTLGEGEKNFSWALFKKHNQRRLVDQSLQQELNMLKGLNAT